MSLRIAVLLAMTYASAFGADGGHIILNDGQSGSTTLSADIGRTVINLRISRINYEQSTANGIDSYDIFLPDEFGVSRGEFLGDGQVLIPTITRMIAVPFDSEPRLRISKSNYVDLPDIVLSQANEEALASYQNSDLSSIAIFQSEIAAGEIAGTMRDVRLYSITFSPVQYDADNSVLRVYDDIEVEIEHSGAKLTYFDNEISEAFLPIYRSVLDNILVFDPLEVTRGAYWIIYPDQFLSHIMPFADWKKAKGYDVELIAKSRIGSNPSYITIKNYISARFDTCQVKPDYINIVADVSMPSSAGIVTKTYSNPHGDGNIESDNYYTFLTDGDYFPEILIGRISIDNVSDIESYTDKLFTYERTPYMGDTGWYLKGTMVAGGYSGDFESPMMTNLWCRDRLLDAGYTRVDTIFEYDWNQVQPYVINNSINGGVSFVNYRGWGWAWGWSSPDYDTYNLSQLSNGPMYPVMTSIVCATGDYNDNTDVCFGEAWIRYSNKGGSGFIGNSNHYAHTRWTNAIDVGIYWGWFVEEVATLGQGQLMGKMTMYDAFPADRQPNGQVELYFNSYNILGDAEMYCWTGIPEIMTVSHDDSLEFGQNLLSVAVEDDSRVPLEGAYVCLWKRGELFTGDFVPENGIINFDVFPETIGDMAITVTARGFAPYEGTATFVNNEITVGYSSHEPDDDNSGESSGNGDGACNPSETIELDITLENFGQSETAFGVSAEISSESPYVEILRNSSDFSDIAPGESGSSDIPYLLEIAPDAVNGADIDLILSITDQNGGSWEAIVRMPVEAAELMVRGLTIEDADNGIIDPGEVVELVISLQNSGLQGITGAQAVLRTFDDQVVIVDSNAVFGDCPPSEFFDNAGDTFMLTVDSDIYVGHLINFTLEISGDGPQYETVTFSEQVGVVSSDDPIGPDNYGYYCFDNTDETYSDRPVYEWIDIDNLSWDYVSLGDDETQTISLPFEITYYGQTYDEISICDNGFVAMGETWWHAWLNTQIPAPQNAAAMIAPFWDDFVQSGLRVYYNHDVTNSRFIIGWKNAYDQDVSRNQTFEIIFLDELAWPTETGDGEIIFQYYQAQSLYSASVGICSPDRRDGIGYMYNNDYADGAATITNSTAIKFTTGSAYETGIDDPGSLPADFSLSQNYPNPFNGSTLIEFSLPEQGKVSLEIYNLLGQKIVTIADGHFEAGIHRATWNADDSPSGVYFLRLTSAERSETKRMTLLK